MRLSLNGFISVCERRGYFRWFPTKLYLKNKYRRCTKHKLNLVTPKTFSEKLQVLKIQYATSTKLPLYTRLTDKIEAKKVVALMIGEQYIIPTIGVWDRFDEIDFSTLPRKFVLKTNHDSGGVVLCKEGDTFDRNKAKKKLEKSLKRNFYWYGREPQYKNITPKIFAEEFIGDENEILEYKLFCFDGNVKSILVCSGIAHGKNRTNTFYDLDFNKLPINGGYPQNKENVRKPEQLETLIYLSEILSAELAQVRVDWYIVCGKIYFGELTFFHNSGFKPLEPIEWEIRFGNWINLDSSE